jgi:uncharacterized membrane protein
MKNKVLHPTNLLIISSLTLSFVRICIEWEMVYMFLVWNLFLAWLPLFFSSKANKVNNKYGQLALLGLALLFIPNASYLITDFVHFRNGSHINVWFDMVLFFSYALTGLTLTMYTIDNLVQTLKARYSKFISSIFHFIVFPIIGCGIYVGRIERWNSWDVFVHPFRFTSEMIQIVSSPKLFELLEFSLLFGGFSAMMYVFLKQMQRTNINAVSTLNSKP